MRGYSCEETKEFFRALKKERDSMTDKKMSWETTRACLVTTLTTKQVESWCSKVEGKFLPLSVYLQQGFKEESVTKCKKEWNDDLEEWCYRVPIKSLSHTETRERIKESVLRQERDASQKKGTKKEDLLDVPTQQKGEQNSQKETKAAEKAANQKVRSNVQLNALAAKGMGVLMKPLDSLERSETKVKALNDPGVEQTHADLLKTLSHSVKEARELVQKHAEQKALPAEEVEALSLPFTAADLKTWPAQVTEVLKSLRPKRKADSDPDGSTPAVPAASPEKTGSPQTSPKAKVAPKKKAAKAKPSPKRRKSTKQPEWICLILFTGAFVTLYLQTWCP